MQEPHILLPTYPFFVCALCYHNQIITITITLLICLLNEVISSASICSELFVFSCPSPNQTFMIIMVSWSVQQNKNIVLAISLICCTAAHHQKQIITGILTISTTHTIQTKSFLLFSSSKLTVQLILKAVAFSGRTVTLPGGTPGGACSVSNSRVGSLGALWPTMFSAITFSWYLVKGCKFCTQISRACGSEMVKICL